MRFEHGSTNLMNRCVNRRPFCITKLSASVLIVFSVSGCAIFQSGTSLTSLMQADDVSTEQSRTPAQPPNTADRPAPADQLDPGEREIAAAFREPAAPSARLLNPDFSQPAAATSDDSSGGHSFSTGGSLVAHSAYPTTIRPVSQARALFDGPAEQQPAVSDPRSVESMERTVEAMAISQAEAGNIRGVPSVAEGSGREKSAHGVPPGTDRSTPPQEQKLLDRLRRLRPDRSPRVLLAHPFERMPNPLQWDWFGNKEDGEQTSPPRAPEGRTTQPKLPTAAEAIDAATDAGDLLDALVVRLERDLTTWPQTDGGSPLQPDEFRRRELNLRLLRLISDQPAAAAEAIDSMSPAEQKFWQELMMAISRFRNPDEDFNYGEHIAATIGQFNTAVQQLEPLSSLSIRRLDFCSRISDFGSIETYPTNTFEPGQRLLIYAEVDNPRSEVSESGDAYRTSFGGTLQIWSASSDVPIESLDLPTKSYESTTRRLDYYLSYEFTLPAHLPAGQYEIQLQIRDEIGSHTADSKVEFTVQ
jgi:hypothetical protein